MRASEKDFQALTAAAKLAGETTEWSATQSAEALNYMGMAGWNAQQAIAALPSVLNLASAGGLDLGRASDIVTDSLTAMGMGFQDLTRFNDVLVGTITRSNTNIEMMGESMRYSAPIASQLGYNIESLAAMIGTLANAGIKASDSGTDLRQAMVRNSKAAKELGTAETDLIGTLKAARAAGWGVNEVIEHYGMIASKSVLVLMSQIDAYERLEKQLHDVKGEADALAKIKLDTLIGDFKILMSTIQGLDIDIFDEKKAGLRGFVQGLTEDIKTSKPYVMDFVASLDAVGDGLIRIGKIAMVGGALYTLPAVVTLAQVAVGRFQVQMALATMEMNGATLAARMYAYVVGTEFVTATWAASNAMARFSMLLGAAFAAFAGWQIGSWLHDNFETARLAGIAFVDGTVKAWYRLEYAAKLVWAGIASSWDAIITRMKLALADFLEYAGKGLDYLPGADGAALALEEVAAGLRISTENSQTFKERQAELRGELDANLKAHQSLIDVMVKEAATQKKIADLPVPIAPIAGPTPTAPASVIPEIAGQTDKETKAIQQQMDALKEQAETYGMSETASGLWRLEMDGATQAQLEQARSLYALIDAKKALEYVDEKHKAVLADGAQVTASVRTEAERFADEIERLNRLYDAGAISAETYNRAVNSQASEGFEKAPSFQGTGTDSSESAMLDSQQKELETWYADQMALLEQYRQQKSDMNATWDEREAQIKQQHEDRLSQIEQSRRQLALASAGQMFGSMAEISKTFAGEQSGLYKVMFATSKAFAIAESSVKLWQAIANASVSAPFPANLANMATVGTAVAGLVSNIMSVGMAHDGIDKVPKTGTWLLEKGERVTTAETSAKLDRMLNNIQRGLTGGSAGGNIGNHDSKPMNVNVYEAAGTSATVQQSTGGSLDVVIERVEQAVSDRIGRGTGLAAFFDRRYGRRV